MLQHETNLWLQVVALVPDLAPCPGRQDWGGGREAYQKLGCCLASTVSYSADAGLQGGHPHKYLDILYQPLKTSDVTDVNTKQGLRTVNKTRDVEHSQPGVQPDSWYLHSTSQLFISM